MSAGFNVLNEDWLRVNNGRTVFSPTDRTLLQLLPCLSFPLFSFVTSSVTFLLDVAAVKRHSVSISLIDGWRSLPGVVLRKALFP